jgi:hypothetical protein
MAATIIPVADMKLDENIFAHNVYDAGKTKTAKLSFKPNDRQPVLVQFSSGGKIPAFGYEAGQFGKNITIHVHDGDELVSLSHFNEDVYDHVVKNKERFFSSETTEETISENSVLVYGVPKSHDFGSWPATFKAYLKSDTVVVDTQGQRITDFETLNRSVWRKAIVELNSIYSAGKTKSGVSKHWRYILVEPKAPEPEIIPL